MHEWDLSASAYSIPIHKRIWPHLANIHLEWIICWSKVKGHIFAITQKIHMLFGTTFHTREWCFMSNRSKVTMASYYLQRDKVLFRPSINITGALITSSEFSCDALSTHLRSGGYSIKIANNIQTVILNLELAQTPTSRCPSPHQLRAKSKGNKRVNVPYGDPWWWRI